VLVSLNRVKRRSPHNEVFNATGREDGQNAHTNSTTLPRRSPFHSRDLPPVDTKQQTLTFGAWSTVHRRPVSPCQRSHRQRTLAPARRAHATGALLREERERRRLEILAAVELSKASLARGEGRTVTTREESGNNPGLHTQIPFCGRIFGADGHYRDMPRMARRGATGTGDWYLSTKSPISPISSRQIFRAALRAAEKHGGYGSSLGLKIATPRSSKCLTLRVTTVRSCSRAVAAINPSAVLSGLPFN
jgi:hypothetical protein